MTSSATIETSNIDHISTTLKSKVLASIRTEVTRVQDCHPDLMSRLKIHRTCQTNRSIIARAVQLLYSVRMVKAVPETLAHRHRTLFNQLRNRLPSIPMTVTIACKTLLSFMQHVQSLNSISVLNLDSSANRSHHISALPSWWNWIRRRTAML